MSPSNIKHIIFLFLLHVCVPVHTCPSLCYCNDVMVDCYDRGLDEIPEGIKITAIYINMKNNRITAINQERLSHLTEAENLRLGNNQVTVLQAGSFVNMTSLKQLDLSSNVITEIEAGAFENLPKIKVLRLSENQLREIGGFLSDLPSLERLDLSSNRLLSISDETFTYLRALNYLSLAGNQITSISRLTFANLTLLSHLDLSRNPLKDVDSIWNGLSKLSSLHLSSCQLTKIPMDLPRNLGYLQLSNNSLTSISADDLSQTKYLSDIYLDDNDIKTIEDDAFTQCPYLSQIHLDNNNLRILPKPIPASVTRFSADGNKIQRVFQFNFDHDSKMVSLSLKNNSIEGLVGNTFSRMANLKYLYLDNNSIKVMYQMTYSRLRQLRTLSLNSNPIGEVEKRGLGGLHTLSRLSLSGIKGHVKGVKDDMFHEVPSVQSLDLQGSPYLASSILNDTNVLQGLRSIRYLNLMKNNLTKLDVILRTWLPKLRSINLMQNQWRCDAELVPLRKWMDESPRTFTSRANLLCHYPDFLKGQAIVDIAVAQFTATTTMSTTTTSVKTSILSTHFERRRTSSEITSFPGGVSTTDTIFTSTPGLSPVKTTKEERSTLAPPLTRAPTSNTFHTISRSSNASSVNTDATSTKAPVKIPSSTPRDSQTKALQTKTAPIRTTRSVKTKELATKPETASSSKARRTTAAEAKISTITTSPAIFSISTSKPSTKTTTFPGTSFLMTSSVQSGIVSSKSPPTHRATIKLTASSSAQTVTSRGTITKLPPTQKPSSTASRNTVKPSSTALSTTRVTRFGNSSAISKTVTRKMQRILTSASTINPAVIVSFTNTRYIASSSTNEGKSRPKTNDTVSQQTYTLRSDQSRIMSATSSSMNGKTKAIVISVSVSLVCLSLGIIILIVVLRYRKRQKSVPIDQNDFHPYHRYEDSSSDTVGIVYRIHGADVISSAGKSTDDICNDHQENNSQISAAIGKKNRSFRPGNSSRFGMGCFSPQSQDDSEMLVYSWDEPNHG